MGNLVKVAHIFDVYCQLSQSSASIEGAVVTDLIMAPKQEYERTMEETPTWAVAAVCFVLIVISILIEYILHIIGHVSIISFCNYLEPDA